jgi:hypothetical protein
MLTLIDPTAADVLGIPVGVRLDVAAVDPNGGGSQEPGLFGGLLIGDVNEGVRDALCVLTLTGTRP